MTLTSTPEKNAVYSRSERMFRWQLYRFGRRFPALKDGSLPALLMIQLIGFAWLAYQHRTGGFNLEQYTTTAVLIGVGGLTFLMAALLSFRLSIRWAFIPAYAAVLLLLVRAKPAGDCSFSTMLIGLVLLEVVAVAYLLRSRFLRLA